MSKHAPASGAALAARRTISEAVAWHDARPRAALPSVRGWLWMVLIAAVFFWMSNPLVFVPGFHLALPKAIAWTTVVVLVTLPWIRVPYVPWPWILFHGFAALSILWTIDPHLTDYTNVLYLKITALALVVAANCEARVVAWGMGLGGVVVTALSIYAYREKMWGASYSTGLEGGVLVQVFAGVGTNENILAYTLSVSLAAMLAIGWPRQALGRGAWLVTMGANACGLYLAQSGTGFLTVLSVLLVFLITSAWPLLRPKQRSHPVLLFTATTAVLLVGVGLVAFGLDKDLSTLSGRAPFWRATWEATLDRAPFMGSGWGAVWQHPWSMVPPNSVAEDIYTRAGYALSHGHNFFLDVLPELGLIGVTLALLMVAYAAREVRRSGLMKGAPDPLTGRFTLFVLTSLLVFGITEPMFTVPLGWWSLALVVALSRQRVPGAHTDERWPSRRRRVGPPKESAALSASFKN